MLTELPRIPVFPEHMISKEIKRLEQDVAEDVIPVSAGIYSERKLMERLQAIPKPELVDYQDSIFYETIDPSKFPCKTAQCPLCGQQYGTKKNQALMCNFCGVWSCDNCMCPRKRYHPRAKDSNSQRYSLCFKCDDKFLNLTLNHSFVEQRALLEEVMRRVRRQKEEVERECDNREQDAEFAREKQNKNKFKVSGLKKEGIDLRKMSAKIKGQSEEEAIKLDVRKKYLVLLNRKKQALKNRQEQKKRNEEEYTKEIPYSNSNLRSIRSLSQNNVYSEIIKMETSPEKENSIKQTTYTGIEESNYSPPANDKQIEPQVEKVQNFFNYDQWGREKEPNQADIEQQPTFQQDQYLPQSDPIPETPLQHQLAEIFSKPQPQIQQPNEDSQDEVQSLDGQVIRIRKAALMRAAIQASHQSRIQAFDQQLSSSGKKCECNIY